MLGLKCKNRQVLRNKEKWIVSNLCRILGSHSTTFWDITPHSPLKANRRFGAIYRLHLQGRRISRAIYQRKSSACNLLSRWYLDLLNIRLWRWRRYVPTKRRLTFNRLYGVISQTTVLFSFEPLHIGSIYPKNNITWIITKPAEDANISRNSEKLNLS
jgi:hypothetical protein